MKEQASFSQQRIWFLHQLYNGLSAYNVGVALHICGNLDVNAMQQSINHIISRHESLRTIFEFIDGSVFQIIADNLHINIERLSDRKAGIEEIIQHVLQEPFDLSKGPLIRSTLYTDAEQSHFLIFSFHHSIVDGWSIDLFLEEISICYNAYTSNYSPTLPELTIQYADFSAWQRQWMRGSVLERYVQYWKQQLRGIPDLLALPTIMRRPQTFSYKGAYFRHRLSREISDSVKAFANDHDCTSFIALLAIFQLLLHRYSGSDCIVTGIPVANRHYKGVDRLIGFFANSLPIRTSFDKDCNVADLLQQVRKTVLEMQDYQDVPLEGIIDAVSPGRSLDSNPIFQVMFSFIPENKGIFCLNGVSSTILPINYTSSKFDITLFACEDSEGLELVFEYATDLFDEPIISSMAAHFGELAKNIISNSTGRLSDIEMLSIQERHRIIYEWNHPTHSDSIAGADERNNSSKIDFSAYSTIHQFVEKHAEEHPEAIAIIFQNKSITYRQLNECANRLAHQLQQLAVGPESLVAVAMDRSMELPVAILGILKAGGAYLPLDPSYPKDRITFMLEDAEVSVIVSSAALSKEFSALNIPIVCLDDDGIQMQPCTNPNCNASRNSLAYVIYTSGSTGKPKGVMVEHRHVIRLFSECHPWFDFNDRDVWTLFHSYAFDFSVWELWGALCFGGKLCIVPYAVSRDPEQFHKLLIQEGITILNQTPSAFRMLIQYDQSLEVTSPYRLRYIIFGGEALERTMLAPWFERYGDTTPELINMYGITETTVHVTYCPIKQKDILRQKNLIGRPIPDLQLYILDAQKRPVPPGIVGELYVGGNGVTRGYLNRPQLTQERFLENHFVAGGRLYKTGDLGRFTTDGSIEYLGRLDNQVKIRGFRIELKEIESVLQSHPIVSSALVVSKGASLIAYFIPTVQQLGQDNIATLRSYLREHLPEYMVPAAFISLVSFPLTENGKIDQKSLPDADPQLRTIGLGYIAPRTEIEKKLAHSWEQLLRVEKVGIRDKFFDLGGDSILSIQAVALARKDGIEMSVADLFLYPSIEELVGKMDCMPDSCGQSSSVLQQPIVHIGRCEMLLLEDRNSLPDNIEDAYPLSFLQKGMIFHNELSETQNLYHDIVSHRIKGFLQRNCLQQAFDTIIANHGMLRTAFDLTNYSEPIQIVFKNVQSTVRFFDLQDISYADQLILFKHWLEDEKRTSFALDQPSLFRCFIHQFSPSEFQLTFSFHHAILDGWSVASAATELLAAYDELLSKVSGQGSTGTGSATDLSSVNTLSSQLHGNDGKKIKSLPAASYGDYIFLERESLARKENRNFWQKMLIGANSIVHATTDQKVAKSHAVFLEKELVAALKNVSLQHHLPLKSIFLSAFVKLFELASGQSNIITGLVTSGRPEVLNGTAILGLFLNSVPFVVPTVQQSWLEHVQTVYRKEGTILPYRRYPLFQIQKDSEINPIFDVIFNYIHFHVLNQLQQLKHIQPISNFGYEATNFRFALNVCLDDMQPNCVALKIDYNEAIIDQEYVCNMIEWYISGLRAIARDPSSPCTTMDLLSKEEQRRLIGEWNESKWQQKHEPKLEESLCVHHLVEKQVKIRPEAIAVVYGDQKISYRQLNERANQLAHCLQEHGVGPESLVALSLERSLDLPIAILAVLKAGGAYLPLDPSYPKERLQFMIDDAKATVLVTDQAYSSEYGNKILKTIYVMDEVLLQYPINNPDCNISQSNLAYVIYTSGSTGKPKGVMVEHRNVSRLFSACQPWFSFDASDVWTLFHSYAFDFSVWEIWGALCFGGKLCVVPYVVSRDPEQFHKLLIQEGVTVLNQTPSAFRQCIQYDQSLPAPSPYSLRYVIFGGEALDPSMVQPWFERYSDSKPSLINMYGITETTVHVTYCPIKLESIPKKKSIIGRPIPDLQLYILDSQKCLVPPGVVGELYVGGNGVARGYLNRPELTEERFIENPFIPGDRLYRTGDLGRFMDNGSVEYLGRCDHQVKIKGFRIELGEIESALQSHPLVRSSLVIAKESRLLAYIIPKTATGILTQSEHDIIANVRSYLREKLPEYMIPAAFIGLSSFPMTENGKIDRKALPDADLQACTMDQEYLPPRNDLEKNLIKIWEKLLRVKKIGIRDRFFDLGGDSIISIQVVAMARQQGMALTVADLFQHPSIEQLSERLERKMLDCSTAQATASQTGFEFYVPEGAEAVYPLSMLQSGMIFHNECSDARDVYHDIIFYRIIGALNMPHLQKALDTLVESHEILRTAFDVTNPSEPVQIVFQRASCSITYYDLQHLQQMEQKSLFDNWIEIEKCIPFQLECSPLLRCFVHQFSPNEFTVSFSFHHAILDGWSVASAITELLNTYEMLLAGDSIAAYKRRTKYVDYINLERASMCLKEDKDFWISQVQRGEPIVVQTEGQKAADTVYVPLEKTLASSIKHWGCAHHLPMKSIFLAAHIKLWELTSGQNNIITGLVTSGRPESEDGTEILGLFLNTIPFTVPTKSQSWLEFVRDVYQHEADLLQHRRYPLFQMQKDSDIRTLFDVSFNYVHFHVLSRLKHLTRLHIAHSYGHEVTNFRFSLNVCIDEASADGIFLKIDYDASSIDRSTVLKMVDRYIRCLTTIVCESENLCQTSALLAIDERNQLIRTWNQTGQEYPLDKCIQEFIEVKAEQAPDATAVVFGDNKISYRQLNERANQLAFHLRRLGVGPESFVAICMDRSLSLPIAILGVLKAGGAYVPLDPSYPNDRLEFILSDTNADVVIVHQATQHIPSCMLRKTIVLSDDWESIAQSIRSENTGNPIALHKPDNASYVIYTSGSTGKPKGVVNIHRGLMNRIWWMQQQYKATPGDKILQKTSIGFDVSVWEFLWPLMAGAELVMAQRGIHVVPTALVDEIQKHGITILHFVPSVLESFLQASEVSLCKSLRYIIASGEALSWKLAMRCTSILEASLHNLYGPTEASIDVTYYQCTPHDQAGFVPIGKPIANTQMYILNRNLEPVPQGTTGEIYIGGIGVARGYLNRKDLTEERFIKDPFIPGQKLYRTGDLGRYLDSGIIEYLGRTDHQIKIRGFRIELGEIEVVLSQHPLVRAAAVVAWEQNGFKQLAAYYIAKDGSSAAEIPSFREYLIERLPQYMVPAAFVCLPCFPQTQSGKIDRKKFPKPDMHSKEDAYRAPSTETEKTIAEVWAKLLHIDRVGVEDDFFELGGDSLSLTMFMLSINRLYGIKLPFSIITEVTTPSAFAKYIETHHAEERA